MNATYRTMETGVMELLRGYGQDLAVARLPASVQPFGAPEAWVAAAAIVGWLVQAGLRSVIDHYVKERLKSRPGALGVEKLKERLRGLDEVVKGLEERQAILVDRLEDTRAYLAQCLDEWERTAPVILRLDDGGRQELTLVLTRIGLTPRRAQRLAGEVAALARRATSGGTGEADGHL